MKRNHGLMACTDVRIKNMKLRSQKSGALSKQIWEAGVFW